MKLAILRGTHRNANNNPFQMSRRESLILPFTLWDCTVSTQRITIHVLAQDVEVRGGCNVAKRFYIKYSGRGI